MKKDGYRQRFWRPISGGCFTLFYTLVLSAILLPFQSHAQAPVNLINLYDWTNVTVVGSGDDPNNYVFIRSSTSADFEGGFTFESGGFMVVQPAISGALNTVPGLTYEISFTVQDDSIYGPNSAQMYFGNTYTQIDLPQHLSGPDYPPIPVNIDFTAVATSANTSMSFQFGLDPNDDEDSLFNLSVMEVPEARGEKLLVLFLGCAFVFKRNWRRLLHMRA